MWLTSFGRFLLFLGFRALCFFGGQVNSCRWVYGRVIGRRRDLGRAGSGMSLLYGILSPPLLFVARICGMCTSIYHSGDETASEKSKNLSSIMYLWGLL